MNKLLAIILFLSFTHEAFNQSEKKLINGEFHGPVKSVSQLNYMGDVKTGVIDTTKVVNSFDEGYNERSHFDTEGRLIQYDSYSTKENKFIAYEKTTYNNKGLKASHELCLFKTKTLFFYDDNGIITKKQVLDANNKVKTYSTCTYNPKTKLFTELKYAAKNDSLLKKRFFTYNKDGEESETTIIYAGTEAQMPPQPDPKTKATSTVQSDSSKTKKVVAKQPTLNSSAGSTQTPVEKKTERKIEQSYFDESLTLNGETAKAMSYDHEHRQLKKSKEETFVYDSYGNWIEKRTIITNRQRITRDNYYTKQYLILTKRSIVYYE